MAWTDEMVEDLKKMWKEGMTTGEIGKKLGVSKNSIVGKVHRLGLSGRPSPIKKKDEADSAASQSQASVKEKKPAPAKKPAASEKKTENQAAAKPAKTEKAPEKENKKKEAEQETYKRPEKVTVADLDNHTCRWPIGDPKDENFHFCGKRVKLGQTYCEEHSAVAYVKAGKK